VHEPDTGVPAGGKQCVDKPVEIDLPDGLRERLLAAARVNALTEIEALIVELKGLGPGAQCLAGELDNLVGRYDMDGVIALINRASGRTD